jgi:hypothetical protein
MRPAKATLLLATLLTSATADFLVSNSTTCTGAFLIAHCSHGVKVLSGVDLKNDYTCDKLVPAENDNYIRNGTMAPQGSPNVRSDEGLCGSGPLDFVKDGEGYIVNDQDGNHVGDCKTDDGMKQECDQWVGMLFFQSIFRCTSSVCS